MSLTHPAVSSVRTAPYDDTALTLLLQRMIALREGDLRMVAAMQDDGPDFHPSARPARSGVDVQPPGSVRPAYQVG